MSPATTKTCANCRVGFRGTNATEEVYCAKCFVKKCEVPEDIDEQFLKLVSETHGSEMAVTNPTNTATLLPMMKDILNHKARLKRLESGIEDDSNKSTKEKNRIKREIFRMREEQKEMDVIMETVKAKMLHLALMQTRQVVASKPTTPTGKSPPNVTTTAAKATPTQTTVIVSAPTPKKREVEETPIKSSTTPSGPTTTASPPKSVIRTPQQSSQEEAEEAAEEQEQPSNLPKQSPVKLAAARFEEAAKKVTTTVTFAKLPAKKLVLPSSPTKKEVNNNDTPVTASSSSEDEGETEGPSMLVRSNSVRDRIKAFEDIQRRASTGSYDRKHGRKVPGAKGVGGRTLTTINSINV